MKRILPLMPAAVFPFTIWLAIGLNVEGEGSGALPALVIALFWLLGLAGAVIACWQAVRGKWEGRRLALASMVIKLLHIQNYVVLFLGVLMTFVFPVLALVVWVLDVMTIVLSGLVGLAAVLRCRMEGRLTAKAAVINGMLQFVFCADVFSAVWVYRNTKEAFLT